MMKPNDNRRICLNQEALIDPYPCEWRDKLTVAAGLSVFDSG